MKSLKITFLVALFFMSLNSCTKQDLNEDDIQVISIDSEHIPFKGGETDD